MDAILQWGSWQFDSADGPIEFRVSGNADTQAVATFYWYPVSFAAPSRTARRDDGVAFVLAPEELVNNGKNALGFHFTSTPKIATNKSLAVTFSGCQLVGKRTTLQQLYQYDLTGSEQAFVMSDGVTVAT